VKAISFGSFIEEKPLYYKEIDHERIHIAYDLLKSHIKHPKTIHIVGTNGKGSTGRMVAHLAYHGGMSVGHFSSPHILKFNERIWVDGVDSSDETLEVAHQKLYYIIGSKMSDSLSYFEYTTLLALVVFEDLDLIVLEAGLGGEYDATNVVDKELSIITPIGIDHQAFLGDTIEEIATTKIRSIEERVLLSPQVYPEVVDIAHQITHLKGAKLYLSSNQPSIHRDDIKDIAREKKWGGYLIENATVATQALDILSIDYKVSSLRSVVLFGRYYPIAPNIRIDVGHNPLAAKALADSLEGSVVLIYNSLDDKDYRAVLEILKPMVESIEIIPIASQRATTIGKIEESADTLGLKHSIFDGYIDSDKDYLVFGSFYTVEAFLDIYSHISTNM